MRFFFFCCFFLSPGPPASVHVSVTLLRADRPADQPVKREHYGSNPFACRRLADEAEQPRCWRREGKNLTHYSKCHDYFPANHPTPPPPHPQFVSSNSRRVRDICFESSRQKGRKRGKIKGVTGFAVQRLRGGGGGKDCVSREETRARILG